MTKKSHIFLLTISITVILIIDIVFFVVVLPMGCNTAMDKFIDSMFTTGVPEENLIITTGRGCTSYKYSEKAKIVSDAYISSFSILVNEEDYSWDTLLMGKLEKFAHYEDFLVMIFDGKYYVFNLEAYAVPESEDDLQYDFEEYSEDEFKERFPQYESFEWRE